MPTFLIIALAWIAVSAAATTAASVFLRAATRADADIDRLARGSELAAMPGLFGERAVCELTRELERAPSRRLHATLN